MRIDTHLHLWRLSDGYDWLTADVEPIRRDLDPADAHRVLRAAGFDRAVLVQAADHARDTARLIELARAHDWIVGVVGWLPLTDPDAVAVALADRPAELVGVRTLLHTEADPAVLGRAEVRASLAHLARAGVPLDVPDAYPALLPHATRAAAETEGLTVVLDHLGKPPEDAAAFADWRQQVRDFAAVPTTVAKVSGLHHGGVPLSASVRARALDWALEQFGADRLMLGSDYPLWELQGDGPFGAGTAHGLEALNDWLQSLPDAHRERIEHGTARAVYSLPLEAPCC